MIVIIGAGPVGCFLGGLLAKSGKDVSIYEEHSIIGKPVHCTGIVTEELGKLIEVKKEFVVNRLSKVKIFSKNSKIELPANDVVLDRAKFDQYLARYAVKHGANLYLEHKFLGIDGSSAVFADKSNKIIKIKADVIIGADGPLSDAAKSNMMFGKRDFYFGMQARAKGKYCKKAYEVYFGSICPGFFAWIVPESEKVARIGVASRTQTKSIFNRFLHLKKIQKKDIIDFQAGLIPVYNKKTTCQKDNVFLVGDAACQVKATTGGGIVPGLKAARILADCIIENKSYKKELKKLNKELLLHLRIRKILNKFSDADYNKLLKIMGSKKMSIFFNKYDRDNPKKLVFKAVFAKPELLRYITKFIN